MDITHVDLAEDTSTKVLENNPNRVVLMFFNIDPGSPIHINQKPIASGDHVYPIPPYTPLIFRKCLGDRPEAAWWAYIAENPGKLIIAEEMKDVITK